MKHLQISGNSWVSRPFRLICYSDISPICFLISDIPFVHVPIRYLSFHITFVIPTLGPFRFRSDFHLYLLILDSSPFPTYTFHISLFTEYHAVLPSSINTPVRLRSTAFGLLYSLRYAPTPSARPITPPSLDLSLPTCPNGFRHLRLPSPKPGPVGTTRAQHQS